jgi:hypothetical protein
MLVTNMSMQSFKLRLIKCFLLTVFVLPCFQTTLVVADSLKQIDKELRTMNRGGDSHSKHVLYGPKWFNVNSNFYKVFATQGGAAYLIDWLGYSAEGFIGGRSATQRFREYVEAQRDFTGEKDTNIRLEIMVPHPRYKEMAEFSLLEAFAIMRPKGFKGELLEQYDYDTFTAKIYKSERKACILLVDLPRSSLLSLSTKDCSQKEQLKKLLDNFDLSRLAVKLNT